jgi:uncharacterized protein YecT (DUF1311 family)
MRLFSFFPFLLVIVTSATAHSAECVKTFDSSKKTALEGDACSSQPLNDADRDLNSSYEKMIGVNSVGLGLWAAQKHWVDARNRCVASGKEDCVAMTRARVAFFDLMAGSESGQHRLMWLGAQSGSVGTGPGGYESKRLIYQFVKPASPGEELFNKVVWQEFMRTRDVVGAAPTGAGRSADRRCSNWMILGTATMNKGVIRIPIQTFLGCNDPQAVETTSHIAVDLDRAMIVQ